MQKESLKTPTPTTGETTGAKELRTDGRRKMLRRSDYYDMQGRRTNTNYRGVYIHRNIYNNGASQSRKMIVR